MSSTRGLAMGFASMGIFIGIFTWFLSRREKELPLLTGTDSSSSSCSVVVKIGGSACTIKDSFEIYNADSMSKISDDLSQLIRSDASFRPIIVHGAGSFGHFQAKQYSVSSGVQSTTGAPTTPNELISPFLREGVAKTRLSVTRLSQHIVSTLTQRGLATVAVSPFPTVSTHNRQLLPSSNGLFYQAVKDVLGLGMVPVLHGDVCLDTSDKRVSVLSGDTLFVQLCEAFRPRHAVFLADVEGVLTAPPGTIPTPQVIAKIYVDKEGNVTLSQGAKGIEMSQAAHDVTGGIRNKLNSAIEVVRKLRIPVFIVKAGSEDAVRAMRGEVPPGGTTVLFRS